MNKLLKRILTVGASLALAAAVAVPAMAAETPATTSPKAEIDVTKIVESLDGTFPLTSSYQFTLAPVSVTKGRENPWKSYDNTNMPMPAATEGDAGPVTVGDGIGANRTSILEVTGLNTAGPDGETSRTKQGAFTPMTYDEIGIYTYKLTEIEPTGAETGLGYDKNVYYINVYVTNVLDENGSPIVATPGTEGNPDKLKVTVSNITLFKEVMEGVNPATVTDMQGKDFGGVDAATSPNDAKIDITTTAKDGDPTTFAINADFTNQFPTGLLTVSKVVTGNIADPNKEFTFTFTPTNAPTGYEYGYKVYTMAGTTPTAEEKSATPIKEDGKLVAAKPTFTLKHKQFAVIYGLPMGLKYTVAETEATGYTTAISVLNGNPSNAADKKTYGNTDPMAESGLVSVLTTEERTIVTTKLTGEETGTRDNYAYFTNYQQSTTPTGVLLRVAPFALLAILLVVGIAFVVINSNKRRKNGYQGL